MSPKGQNITPTHLYQTLKHAISLQSGRGIDNCSCNMGTWFAVRHHKIEMLAHQGDVAWWVVLWSTRLINFHVYTKPPLISCSRFYIFSWFLLPKWSIIMANYGKLHATVQGRPTHSHTSAVSELATMMHLWTYLMMFLTVSIFNDVPHCEHI